MEKCPCPIEMWQNHAKLHATARNLRLPHMVSISATVKIRVDGPWSHGAVCQLCQLGRTMVTHVSFIFCRDENPSFFRVLGSKGLGQVPWPVLEVEALEVLVRRNVKRNDIEGSQKDI